MYIFIKYMDIYVNKYRQYFEIEKKRHVKLASPLNYNISTPLANIEEDGQTYITTYLTTWNIWDATKSADP